MQKGGGGQITCKKAYVTNGRPQRGPLIRQNYRILGLPLSLGFCNRGYEERINILAEKY